MSIKGKCNGIFFKPQYKVYKEASMFYFNLPFSDVPSQKYLNPRVRTKKLVNSVFYHRDISFHIFLNSLGFYVSKMLVLWLVYSNMCGKNFSIYGVHILRKSLNLCFFTHAPVPHSKLLVEFLKICFPQDRRGGRKL